jgi:uncharacterized membrane protein YccC
MALSSGFAAAVGVLACCAFWIATGWHDGGLAAQMGAVFCSIFAFMGSAAWMLPGFTVSANMPMMLGLQSYLTVDFASFLNNCIATIVGVLAATTVTATIRSIGAQQGARRLLRAGRRDVARIATCDDLADIQALIRRVVDRLGLLVPRLAASGDATLRTEDVLSDLRTGINIAELQRLRR